MKRQRKSPKQGKPQKTELRSRNQHGKKSNKTRTPEKRKSPEFKKSEERQAKKKKKKVTKRPLQIT